jgi:hypothetical protein
VWFDQATKERQRIVEVEINDSNDGKDFQTTSSTFNNTIRKKMPDSDNQDTDGLRNVRWSVEQTEADSDWFQKRNAQLATDFWTLAMDHDSPVSLSATRDYHHFHPIENNRPRFREPAITEGRAQSGRHALEDYQMQPMLLEEGNKKRLLMGKGLVQIDGEGGWSGRIFVPTRRNSRWSKPTLRNRGILSESGPMAQ